MKFYLSPKIKKYVNCADDGCDSYYKDYGRKVYGKNEIYNNGRKYYNDNSSNLVSLFILIFLIIIAIGLGICSWFLLPDVVTVQVGMDGQVTNTMPKLLAILIPLGISAAGSVINLTDKKENSFKGFVLALVGIAAMLLTLFFNR